MKMVHKIQEQMCLLLISTFTNIILLSLTEDSLRLNTSLLLERCCRILKQWSSNSPCPTYRGIACELTSTVLMIYGEGSRLCSERW